jgi:hypothetical protein
MITIEVRDGFIIVTVSACTFVLTHAQIITAWRHSGG